MNKCPKCSRYGLEYFTSAKVARCLLCGHSEVVPTRDDFFSLFPNGRSVTSTEEEKARHQRCSLPVKFM